MNSKDLLRRDFLRTAGAAGFAVPYLISVRRWPSPANRRPTIG